MSAIAERPDGTRVHFMPYPTPIKEANGKVIGAVNMLVDITEQKVAEETQARLAAIVEQSDDAIVSKSLDGVIQTWNRGAERMFGYCAEEAVGRHITLIIPEERRAEEDMVLAKVRSGETVDHFETVRRAKDGRLIDISLTVSPIREAQGRVIGASKIARDITERKRLDAELYALVGKLREADIRKDEFIAMLAHELRNPLSAIAVATDLLTRSKLEDRKARFAVPAIERQVRQLRRLVDDLLNVARITSGKLTLRKEPLELRDFAERAIGDYRALVPKGTSIVVAGAEAWVDADPVRLKQMIENLLDHATKYERRKPQAASKHRVLVVEDEADSRECLKLLLETEGHQVALTDNAAAALEEIARFRPDIALVDVGLPGMDGYELARRARTLPGGKKLKLIAITGFGGDKHRARAKRAGFDMHVVKPISYEQLARVFSGG